MAIDPDKQLPGENETVNERFFDSLLRHQIGLMMLAGSMGRRAQRLLDATEGEFSKTLVGSLQTGKERFSAKRTLALQKLLKELRKQRQDAWDQITLEWVEEAQELAGAEPALVDGLLKTVAPVVLATNLPSPATARRDAVNVPFQGRTLEEWTQNLAAADLARFEQQVKIGLTQGENPRQIARRIVGTRAARGRNGVFQITRRQTQDLTRTLVNAVANQARRSYFLANKDIFEQELYVATLDSRTTPICRSLDGERFPVGEGPIPPLHFNCRSLRVAIISAEAIGVRPARSFTNKQLLRDFARSRKLSPAPKRRADLPRGSRGDFDQFARARMRASTGTVPAKVTYNQWLKRQTAMFQEDLLGKTKARLFRQGDLPLSRFVDSSGHEFTLNILARRDRQAFIAAGLDPEDFL